MREIFRKKMQNFGEVLGINERGLYDLSQLSPVEENQFLKSIMAYHDMEQGPQITIKTLFPIDFQFPQATKMSDNMLSQKLDEIERILNKYEIFLELVSGCSPRIVYKYFLDDVLTDKIAVTRPEGMHRVIDGYGGWCPDCFQLPYCESAKETWDEGELQKYCN